MKSTTGFIFGLVACTACFPLSTQRPIIDNDSNNLLEKRSPAGRSINEGLPCRTFALGRLSWHRASSGARHRVKQAKWQSRFDTITTGGKKGARLAAKEAAKYRSKEQENPQVSKAAHIAAYSNLAIIKAAEAANQP